MRDCCRSTASAAVCAACAHGLPPSRWCSCSRSSPRSHCQCCRQHQQNCSGICSVPYRTTLLTLLTCARRVWATCSRLLARGIVDAAIFVLSTAVLAELLLCCLHVCLKLFQICGLQLGFGSSRFMCPFLFRQLLLFS